MLRHRIITGPLLIVALLLVVWLDMALEGWSLPSGARSVAESLGWTSAHWPRGTALAALGVLLVPLMAREMAQMTRKAGLLASEPLAMIGALLGFVVVIGLRRAPDWSVAPLLASYFVALLIAGLIRFARGHNVQGVMAATGALLLTCVYTGVLAAFWLAIRHGHSAWVLVGAMLTTKSCDIGAYFTGVAFGRHKLIPWLSPKKTWEGLAGGVAAAALVGAGFSACTRWLPDSADQLSWWLGALGGVIVALVGQFGDLIESLFKRDAGVKDSGELLPGMGGILDVLDSPLVAGPAVYWFLVAATGR